jgi:ferrochelatase
MPEYGIILLNLGGPDSIRSIQPFLYNLFSDPDIFRFPFGSVTQRFFARIISKLRARRLSKIYLEIGGRSPILSYTYVQAKGLERKLRLMIDCHVYIGMRYWHPMIDEAVEQAIKDGVRKIILVSLYPQFSRTTVGSSLNEFNRVIERLNLCRIEVYPVKSYPDNELYIKAVCERIDESIVKFSPDELKSFGMIFSAHSIPMKFVEDGDPYPLEIKRSVDAVLNHLKTKSKFKDIYQSARSAISYQSKVGPVRWLEPSTIDTVKKFVLDGIKNILVVPISFVSDNIETLYELGIKLRDIAIESGVNKFVVAEALNDSDTFIEALKNIVMEAIKNA